MDGSLRLPVPGRWSILITPAKKTPPLASRNSQGGAITFGARIDPPVAERRRRVDRNASAALGGRGAARL